MERMEQDREYVCRRAAIMSLEKIYGKAGADRARIDEALEERFGMRLDELSRLMDTPRKPAAGPYLIRIGENAEEVVGRLEHEGEVVRRLVREIRDGERAEALKELERGIDARVFLKKVTGDALEVSVTRTDFRGREVVSEERIITGEAAR